MGDMSVKLSTHSRLFIWNLVDCNGDVPPAAFFAPVFFSLWNIKREAKWRGESEPLERESEKE